MVLLQDTGFLPTWRVGEFCWWSWKNSMYYQVE